jgi:ubiquinone/menaquinone biosynthesis C-methylase UbiE
MDTSPYQDKDYLLHDQYKDSSHLRERYQILRQLGLDFPTWYRWVFDHIPQTPHQRLLEVGAGPGFFWQENLDRLPATWKITVSDFSPGMVQEAQANLAHVSQQFQFSQVDVQNIPFADASFDGVIANNMLYHVPDISRALSEVRRVLKPEGKFYATTVSDASFREMGDTSELKLELPGFTLSNGAEIFSSWFSHVELERWEQQLVITHAETLIAMLRSLATSDKPLDEDRLRQGLARHEPLHLPFVSGLFIAQGRKTT